MSTPPTGDRGWGKGKWGSSQWGSGITPPPSAPVITPLAPLPDETGIAQSRPLTVSFTDNTGIALSTLRFTVSGIIYVLGGSAQNGATLVTTPNTGNGFDVELTLPEVFQLGSRQEITISIKDVDGEEEEAQYFFYVGVGPRLISVSNPMPGVLVAHFNEAMKHDGAFLSPSNWKVEAVTTGASEVVITKILANLTRANTAVLHHTGGGSVYELTVLGLVSQDADPLELSQNTAVFEIVFGEEEEPTIRLFDTIFGPVGISQNEKLRRTIDDHVVSRSIAIGMDEQFRLRFQTLDGSAGRDGRPGTRRT